MVRKRVGLLFGGRSGEHEVSLESARGILAGLDPRRYEVVAIGIRKDGSWVAGDEALALLGLESHASHARGGGRGGPGVLRALAPPFGPGRIPGIDVFFPILHGTFGEDGSLQGLLRILDVPFVGASVLASALAMDKDASKRLLREAGLEVARHLVLRRGDRASLSHEAAVERLGSPLFVKPANLGSSVGIRKVTGAAGFDAALAQAFAYDRKVIVEELVEGREIECAVLGNERPEASLPGEIRPRHDFYSYEAKYLDEHGADLLIPAPIPPAARRRIQRCALDAYLALECEGMARVDFFLRPDGTPVVNELNTLPGFTPISMYPKLWEASGLPLPALLDRLIELAEERSRHEARLARSRRPAREEPHR